MNLTEATILALQGKLLKEEKEVKKEAIDIISNDTVVSVDDDKTEVITDEEVVTVQDTKEALEDNKEEETAVEEILPEEQAEETTEEVEGEPIEENKIISESKEDKLDLDDCIKTVAQEMGVNFNRESPFEYFYAPDSDEFIPGETPEYAVFYDKILHNMGYGENPVLDDCNAVVEEISDGKNEMELNYNGKEITLDVIAWDDLDDVKDNVESIIELLNTKKIDEEEVKEEKVEESKDIKIGNKVRLIKTNVSYNNQTGKVVYISDIAKDPFVIELDDGRIDNFNEDEIEVLKEEKVEESLASDAADEIAHDDRYYNAGTGNIDVFLAREVADIAETLGDDYSEWLDKESIKEIIAELKEEDYLWEPLAQATREKIEDKVDWIRKDDPASRYYDGDLSELEEGCLKTEKCNKEDKKHSIKVKVTERKLEEGSTIQVIEEYSAEDLDDQLWSGARDRWVDFTDDQKEMLINIFNDAYAAATTIEEMPSLVTFNDFIWFDSDSYIEDEEKDLEENKKIEEDKLEPVYDSAASFYGKAETDGDKLYSYNTLVAEMKDGKPVVYNLQSLTTTRHVREWLKQNGFEATTKKQIAKDYGTEDIIL